MKSTECSNSIWAIRVDNESGGQIEITSLISLVNAAVFTNELGGTVSGTGILDATGGTFTNEGTVSPGFSSGTLTVQEDFTQTITGELLIEITGSPGSGNFDLLVVTDDAFLDGTLKVVLSGFAPQLGDQYTILTSASLNGTTFANEMMPLGGGGLPIFQVDYNNIVPNAVVLTAVVLIPLPSSVWMGVVLLAAWGLCACRRMRALSSRRPR